MAFRYSSLQTSPSQPLVPADLPVAPGGDTAWHLDTLAHPNHWSIQIYQLPLEERHSMAFRYSSLHTSPSQPCFFRVVEGGIPPPPPENGFSPLSFSQFSLDFFKII